jgi:hypothetical protein
MPFNPPRKTFSEQNIPRNPIFSNISFPFHDNMNNAIYMYHQNMPYGLSGSININKPIFDNKPRYQKDYTPNSFTSNHKLGCMFDNMYLDVKNKKETINMNTMLKDRDIIALLKTQKGSRMMQKYVNKRSSEEIFSILEKKFKLYLRVNV